MQIRVTGIKELQSRLSDTAKRQLPFALSQALNNTAYGAHGAVKREIKDSFDRPTPVVQRSARYTKADKRNLAVRIYIVGEEAAVNVARILRPHIYGGDRVVKASERKLRRLGHMGQNQWITPGPGAPLDRHGNISSANMKKIIAQIEGSGIAGYNKMNKTTSRRGIGTLYWIQRVGVFKRTGPNSSIPILFFTNKKPRYEKRFDFDYVVENHFKKHFNNNFQKAWHYALKTAK